MWLNDVTKVIRGLITLQYSFWIGFESERVK